MRDVPATDLQTRDDIFKLVPDSDFIVHNGLRVLVKKITVAMGGDACVEGVVQAWSTDHKYILYYGDLVFWGPKGFARNLTEYLNHQFIGKRN